MTQLIREQLAALLRDAIRNAQAAGTLPNFDVPALDLVRPKQSTHGDYAANVALGLAKVARMAPIKIAQAIADHIPAHETLGKVDVAPPGYINLTLSDAWLKEQVQAILDAGMAWGNLDLGKGQRVQVEHGSANPTGPLTIGSGRNVVIGDTIANILDAVGYAMQREYYINDSGSQVRHFGESIYARYAQAFGKDVPFPEDGYKGEYILDVAEAIKQEHDDKYLNMDQVEATRTLGRIGIDKMIESAKLTLERINIRYDRWFSERSLYESGLFDQMLELLREKDLLYEKEDATWFKVTQFGGEKDAVVVRSPNVIANADERPTYFASDIAYVHDKFLDRGFDRVIYVWGADHQGDLPRMDAIRQVFDIDPSRLTIVIYQLVNLTRGSEEVRQSKRSGQFVLLDDVIDEIGADAIRFMLLTRTVDSKLTLDLELAKEQSDKNPVYYVQYAHARIASILRKAQEEGLSLDPPYHLDRLEHPGDFALVRKMLELPEVITQAARDLAPHHLTYYAQDLASTFSAFYRDCRVVDHEAPELSAARLALSRAAQSVLARVLSLMGMSAPEKM